MGEVSDWIGCGGRVILIDKEHTIMARSLFSSSRFHLCTPTPRKAAPRQNTLRAPNGTYVLHFKRSASQSISTYTKVSCTRQRILRRGTTHRSTTHSKIIPPKRLVFNSRINSQRKDDGGNGYENDDGGCYIGSFVFEDGW